MGYRGVPIKFSFERAGTYRFALAIPAAQSSCFGSADKTQSRPSVGSITTVNWRRMGSPTFGVPSAMKRISARIRKEIEASMPVLEQYVTEIDRIERLRVELGIAVQRARLEILDRWNSQKL